MVGKVIRKAVQLIIYVFVQLYAGYGPYSSCAYCIFALSTNHNVVGSLSIHDLNNWAVQTFLLVD